MIRTRAEMVERIGDAAGQPHLWAPLLEEIAWIADCDGSTVVSVDADRNMRFFATPTLSAMVDAYLRDGWMERDPRTAALLAQRPEGFVADHDLLTRAQLVSDPFYTTVLRPNGGGWSVGAVVDCPSEPSVVLRCERAYERGPIGREVVHRLDQLRPHLARSIRQSVRTALERMRATASALDLVGIPAAIVRPNGRPVAVNTTMHALGRTWIKAAFPRLTLANPIADATLQAALARTVGEGGADEQTIPIAANGASAPSIIHLLPLRGRVADVFAPMASVVILTPLERAAIPEATVLQGLFDFTPAESRLAHAIGSGDSPREAAEHLSISEETARTVLKRVFAKMGVSRQSDLIAMLAGPTFRRPAP
jgi:DNA-binding CsgD family transcriptional regulator